MNNGNFSNPIIVGRLASDPELVCKGSKVVTTFKLADDDRGNITFHSMVAEGKQAIICKQYLYKGCLCCIEGKYNAAGDKIMAERVTFLSNRH